MTDAARVRLAQVIEAELALVARFHDLLQREQELLIAGDTDALMTLTTRKSDLHKQLQGQHDALSLILGQLGHPPSSAAVRSVCANLPDTLERWNQVLARSAEIRALNEINGKLIIERMQNNQAALSVLLAAADQPSLYDADGTARPSGRGRHLGSA